MVISDISVKLPVFATVLSMLILAFGILSFRDLPLREYPDISTPVVSVMTSYRGASAQVMESKVTRLIEDQISGIEGVESISSQSSDGRSSVSVEFSISRDIDQAANDVRDKVARIVSSLPYWAPKTCWTKIRARPVLGDRKLQRRSVPPRAVRRGGS